MANKLMYQAAMIAAIFALVAIGVQMAATSSMPDGVMPQPYGQPLEDFAQTINTQPRTTLLFFAGDTIFPLSYLMVFAGLFVLTWDRARVFALIGLGAGILTAILDSAENAMFITYALMAESGTQVADPALVTVYFLTTLKWTAAFATMYAFGLIFPRETLLDKIIMTLMLVFPVFGAVSLAAPELIVWRGLFLLAGMALFAILFWNQSR